MGGLQGSYSGCGKYRVGAEKSWTISRPSGGSYPGLPTPGRMQRKKNLPSCSHPFETYTIRLLSSQAIDWYRLHVGAGRREKVIEVGIQISRLVPWWGKSA